jgi:Cdc6-like AAA superfamily ATPase
MVVILDEVDQLEEPSGIYNLHSLPQFAIICIVNQIAPTLPFTFEGTKH